MRSATRLFPVRLIGVALGLALLAAFAVQDLRGE